MALFDNVTYTFYTTTLGRSEVPNATEFDRYKLENTQYLRNLINDGLLNERMTNGIDTAACMMIEVDYKAAQVEAGETAVDTNESINGYSHSLDTSERAAFIAKNMKSTAEKKYYYIRLFCHVKAGVQ